MIAEITANTEYHPTAPRFRRYTSTFDDYDGTEDADAGQALYGTGETELDALEELLEGAQDLEDAERILAAENAIEDALNRQPVKHTEAPKVKLTSQPKPFTQWMHEVMVWADSETLDALYLRTRPLYSPSSHRWLMYKGEPIQALEPRYKIS